MMIKNKRTSKQARPVVEIFLGHPFYFCQVILPFFIVHKDVTGKEAVM